MRDRANGKPKRVRKRTRSAVRHQSKESTPVADSFTATIEKLRANAAELEERILRIQAQLARKPGG
jgi:hypothetical protein